MPYGWCHFPEFDQDYFTGLVSESYTQNARGKWTFVKPSGVRNEPLDTWVGARAAVLACGIDEFTERQWAALEARLPVGLLGPGVAAPPVPDELPTRRVKSRDPDAAPPAPSMTAPPPPLPRRPGRVFKNSYLQGG